MTRTPGWQRLKSKEEIVREGRGPAGQVGLVGLGKDVFSLLSELRIHCRVFSRGDMH